MKDNKLTVGRLVIAVITTAVEETGIYAVWRWLLPESGIFLPVWVLVTAMSVWFGFSVWLFIFTTHYLRRQPHIGLPSMIGTIGRAAVPLSPEGMVNIRGELWGATSIDGNIRKGEKIVVAGEKGLKLKVRRLNPAGSTR